MYRNRGPRRKTKANKVHYLKVGSKDKRPEVKLYKIFAVISKTKSDRTLSEIKPIGYAKSHNQTAAEAKFRRENPEAVSNSTRIVAANAI